MANPEQLAILKQGVRTWNRWRAQNPEIRPDLISTNLSNTDLSFADFSNADLRDANLSNADLSNAELKSANLNKADLSNANLSDANLSKANLSEANLSRASLESANLSYTSAILANLSKANLNKANLRAANLSKADLNNADLNNADLSKTILRAANLSKASLKKANVKSGDLIFTNLTFANLSAANLSNASFRVANLSNANLSNTDLSKTNLSEANLSEANLRSADLSAVQALATNFSQATLTGACIADWNVNAQTQLQNVTCDYIYLRYGSKTSFTDRRPHDPNKIFTPGEFTERFQKVLDTVDLFFADGIDWKAFLASFQDLQAQYGDDNLIVQGFERKGNGLEVRLAVSADLDKAEIERNALQQYEAQLQLIETKYRERLHAQDREIEIYKQQSADMLELAKLAASRPITVEAKAEAVADNQSNNTNYNIQKSKFGGGFAAEGGIQFGGPLIDASSQQNLAEAAQDIQELLNQLSTTYPTDTSAQQMMVATKAVEEIEKNPALKQRVIAALKAGGTEALKELVDHPAVNILLAAIEGWQKPE